LRGFTGRSNVVSLCERRKPITEGKASNVIIKRDFDLMPYKERFDYLCRMYETGYIVREQALRFMGLWHTAKFLERFPVE